MAIPNMWEFPGGKVEKNEDLFEALQREISEELHCTIDELELFHEHTHDYGALIVQLVAIKCRIVEGHPVSTEHAKVIWLKRENLRSLVWAPADIPAVEKLMKEKIEKYQ